jgi:hypothetical protein
MSADLLGYRAYTDTAQPVAASRSAFDPALDSQFWQHGWWDDRGWFPEGGVMEHGATQHEDVTFLFITNKEFGIHFVGDDSDPDAPTMAT